MLFSNLKEKQQKAYRLQSYDDILLATLCSMFTYNGMAKTVNKHFIEQYRLMEGACAIWKNNGKFICSRVDFGGTPDENGIGTIAICATRNGVVKQFDNWKENKDVAIIFNNSIYSPDLSIGITSDMLMETDISMKANLLHARLHPIPVAKNDKEEKAIRKAEDDIKDGKLTTVLSDDLLADIGESKDVAIPTINLTEVKDSDKIQYLAKFRDDLMRWFYSLNGMNSQGSSKMAQQTVDEVNQDSCSSMIIPHDRYRCAIEGVDMCNEKFGDDPDWIEASVDFSECWQNRLADFTQEFAEDPNDDEVVQDDQNGESQPQDVVGDEEDKPQDVDDKEKDDENSEKD